MKKNIYLIRFLSIFAVLLMPFACLAFFFFMVLSAPAGWDTIAGIVAFFLIIIFVKILAKMFKKYYAK